MNKVRLKKIKNVAAKITDLTDDIIIQKEELESLLWEEEDYHDNMPENLQYSYQGERSEEAIDTLTDGVNGIDRSIEEIETALKTIENEIDNISDLIGDIEMLD